MQQTGTLRKRKRRNIAKVAGLGVVPYDENQDTSADFVGFETSGNKVFEPSTRNGHVSFSLGKLQDQSFRDGRRNNQDFNMEFEIDDVEYVTPDENRRESTEMFGTEKNRPYFINDTTYCRFRLLLLLGVTTGTFPWKWNSQTYQIDVWTGRWFKAWYIFWVFFTINSTSLFIFQFYAFYLQLTTDEPLEYRQIFSSTFSIFWFFNACYFNVNSYYYRDYTRQYINTLFDLNRKMVDRYVTDISDYVQGGRIVNVAILTNISQVFVSCILFTATPYQPWYLYSYVYSPTNPWYTLIPGFFHQYMICGQVITGYMLTSWIFNAHTNTVQFWLKEIHLHNDTGYTRETLRVKATAFKIFRTLQILCTIFNDCLAPMAIPFVKLHVMVAMIPCGYVMIRSMNHYFLDEFPGILSYPIGVFDTVTVGFSILSMAAEMHDLGCSFVESWSRTKQKFMRKVLRSCPTLKVRVGHYYHITVSTTITFFRVTTDYVIDSIITFPA